MIFAHSCTRTYTSICSSILNCLNGYKFIKKEIEEKEKPYARKASVRALRLIRAPNAELVLYCCVAVNVHLGVCKFSSVQTVLQLFAV